MSDLQLILLTYAVAAGFAAAFLYARHKQRKAEDALRIERAASERHARARIGLPDQPSN
ncbi:MAG: hypothetical protein VB138_15340 [Burkholderia sp.]